MRDTVVAELATDPTKDVLLAAISAMEQSVGQKSFAQRYKDFIEVAADHMTILGPYMPALAQLLANIF